MCRNVFGITVNFFDSNSDEKTEKYPLTIGGIIRWVYESRGIVVSKSSVCAVRDKCGAKDISAGAAKVVPNIKSKKEQAVLDAFKALGVIK